MILLHEILGLIYTKQKQKTLRYLDLRFHIKDHVIIHVNFLSYVVDDVVIINNNSLAKISNFVSLRFCKFEGVFSKI